MRAVDRSMNRDLTEGMVDGKIKKANPDRGGLVEDASSLHRGSLGSDYDLKTIGELNPSDERPDIVGLLP